ncbi:MAG: CDP-diacylglycerol--serine O-phosphatidyltransferase [Parvularculales bacterium]
MNTEDQKNVSSRVMRRRRRERLRSLPLRNLIPNVLTILSVCAGLTALRFGFEGQFKLAVAMVLMAGLFDALDGRVARLLKSATRFGAELDSLADFFNFGVVPILLIYLWALQTAPDAGWMVVLGYSICCALRLARFNVAQDDDIEQPWATDYFIGVPAPAAATLVMMPFYLGFLGWEGVVYWPILTVLYTGLISFLMVSRIPTFSGKRLVRRVRLDMALLTLVLIGLLAAAFISYPWLTLALICTGYLALLPVSYKRYQRLNSQ